MTLSGLKLYFFEEETTALVLSWEGTQPLELRGPAGNEWNIFIVMLRQLSNARKNQLKAPKAPY